MIARIIAITTMATEMTKPHDVFERNLILRIRLCELRPILLGRARALLVAPMETIGATLCVRP
jgi:hypothetical protein